MKIRLVRVQKDFDFPFPSGTEHCPSALFFNVGLGDEEPYKVVVAYTNRDAHEKKDRRRIHVGLEVGSAFRSIVQFEGSEDYAQTGDCVYAIKRFDGNEWIPTTEPVPLEYAAHRIVIFERHVNKGGSDHWGILVNEGEIDDMIRVAIVRASHKGFAEVR
ncbi:MAG: hypothetical protein IPJ61_21170 [Tessaracoccus sp.]|uniref:hypothetical protein n=1 Tax=Tessaracoccus sp. TaxID=1971211 RepID=UPI001EB31E32|nr:hypothetical protein [Tessaracoccus sp.]MBK7823500.1 hypothetical protein [Tessaracoccus sp.]